MVMTMPTKICVCTKQNNLNQNSKSNSALPQANDSTSHLSLVRSRTCTSTSRGKLSNSLTLQSQQSQHAALQSLHTVPTLRLSQNKTTEQNSTKTNFFVSNLFIFSLQLTTTVMEFLCFFSRRNDRKLDSLWPKIQEFCTVFILVKAGLRIKSHSLSDYV